MEVNHYGKVYHHAHPMLRGELFDGTFIVQEKVDGSQISWGVTEDGELLVNSRNQKIYLDNVEGMFANGVNALQALKDKFTPGYVYRGEYLSKPKHNHVAYDRVPEHHIIMFDIMTELEAYLPPVAVADEAARVGMEVVPTFFDGFTAPSRASMEEIREFLTSTPVLGGPLMEGVVIKNYTNYGRDGKILKGKLVNEKYLERAKTEGNKVSGHDITDQVAAMFNKENKWLKAVQHLKEEGSIIGAPEDIGKLMKEINCDLREEEEEVIKNALFKWAWPNISRQVVRGFPEWYKAQLEEVA